MYIFRYYVLDNVGKYGNLDKLDGRVELDCETEYKMHLQALGLQVLFEDSAKDTSQAISNAELQLCAVWIDQMKSHIFLSSSNEYGKVPLYIVPKMRLFLPLVMTRLPDLYTKLYMQHCFKKTKCYACRAIPKMPAMCLMCGDIVCCAAKCKNDYGFKDRYQRPLTGGCSIHAEFCGNGTCAFILLKECQLLVCMKGGRSCMYTSLYLDEHGEEDRGLKRGVLLTLEQGRLENLRFMLANNTFEHESRLLSDTYLNWVRRSPQF